MRKDLLSGLGLLLIATGFYWAATGIQVSTLADDFGPQGLPMALAVCLGVVAIGLIGRALIARSAALSQPEPSSEASKDEPEEATLPRALGLLAIGAGYVAIVRVVGYVPAIALLIATVALYEGLRPSFRLVVVALGGAVFFWLLFVQVLGVPQPQGLGF
jgi:putative tricarboxylic transport membrane protein